MDLHFEKQFMWDSWEKRSKANKAACSRSSAHSGSHKGQTNEKNKLATQN